MPKMIAQVSPNVLLNAFVGLFSKDEAELEQLVPMPRRSDSASDPSTRIDQIRYEQMLERELDRQLLTACEREDTDTLDRVRAALYED